MIYVWIDALLNYLSGLGGDLFDTYWENAHHVIGKDILRFHAVYLPCLLLSLDLPLPKKILAHGWWTAEGEKISKSKGNAIDPNKVVSQVGSDAFRYFLLREISVGSDGDFSEQALIARVNGDLSNGYGNLLNRTLGLLKKYRGSILPPPVDCAEGLRGLISESRERLILALDECDPQEALKIIWQVIRAGNKYVDETAPWTLGKQGKEEELDAVLYNLVELLRIVGVWTLPFLPEKSVGLLDAIKATERSFESTSHWGLQKGGACLDSSALLFPRI